MCFFNGKKDRLKIENTIIFFSSSFRLDCLFSTGDCTLLNVKPYYVIPCYAQWRPYQSSLQKYNGIKKNYSRACIKTA